MNLHFNLFDFLAQTKKEKEICILNCEKNFKTKDEVIFVNNSKSKNH